MKFKRLNESFTADELYDKVVDYVAEYLIDTIYEIKKVLPSEVAGYKSEYAEDNYDEREGEHYLRKAAEYYADGFIANAPDVIEENYKCSVHRSKHLNK